MFQSSSGRPVWRSDFGRWRKCGQGDSHPPSLVEQLHGKLILKQSTDCPLETYPDNERPRKF